MVGEDTNKLMGYLPPTVSRKLDQPLAIIIQSSSSAGKTSLMDNILSSVPPEDQVKYSAMTGQSLFYVGEQDLKHKVLAIVEEEGAETRGPQTANTNPEPVKIAAQVTGWMRSGA